MKKVLIFAVACTSTVLSMAQLSTRENNDQQYLVGTRPEAGDYSLFFNLNLGNVLGGSGSALDADLVKFRYYLDDLSAVRVGIGMERSGKTYSGEIDTSATGGIPFGPTSVSLGADDYLTAQDSSWSNRTWKITGGYEKHFSNSNIFDVYVGGDLTLGFQTEKIRFSEETNTGNTYEERITTNSTMIGLRPFVGLQMFVVDLPVSVGVEYGINAEWMIGGRQRTAIEETGDNDQSLDFFSPNNGSNRRFSSLGQRSNTFETLSNVKLVLNFYFGRGNGGSSAE